MPPLTSSQKFWLLGLAIGAAIWSGWLFAKVLHPKSRQRIYGLAHATVGAVLLMTVAGTTLAMACELSFIRRNPNWSFLPVAMFLLLPVASIYDAADKARKAKPGPASPMLTILIQWFQSEDRFWNKKHDGPKISFDFRLFFGFHVCMMALMVFRAGIVSQMVVICAAALTALVLSIRNRRRSGWKWPRTSWKKAVGVLAVVAPGLLFLGAALPGKTVFDPRLFPWLSAGGGILLFGILNGLNIVHKSEEEFLANCGVKSMTVLPLPPATSSNPQLSSSKRVAMIVFKIYFFVAFMTFVSFMWKFNEAYRGGSEKPTATQTQRLTNHGRTVYITPNQERLVSLLKTFSMVGVVSSVLVGIFLNIASRRRITDAKLLKIKGRFDN
jgi:hypothetical protein